MSEMKINSKKKIEIPYWLLKLLPMWMYVCPKCRKGVKKNSHECSHCGEKYPLTLKVPPAFLKDPKKLEAYVHKHVFPRVSEFERNYLTQYFTVLFSDGFESNNFNAWTQVLGSPTVQSIIVHSGTYAAKAIATTNCCVKQTVSTYPDVFFRGYFYLPVLPALGQGVNLIKIGDAGWDNAVIANLWHKADTDVIIWQIFTSLGIFYAGDSLISANTWFAVEIERKSGTGVNGIATLWVNGVQLLQTTTETYTTESQIFIAGNENSDAANFTVYGDAFVIADAYIGPESKPKGTIAIHAKLAGII